MYIRNREPSVDEMLSDPLIQLVMERDGSSDDEVRTLMAETKRRLEADSFSDSKRRADR
jgi:hypothetical protein